MSAARDGSSHSEPEEPRTCVHNQTRVDHVLKQNAKGAEV